MASNICVIRHMSEITYVFSNKVRYKGGVTKYPKGALKCRKSQPRSNLSLFSNHFEALKAHGIRHGHGRASGGVCVTARPRSRSRITRTQFCLHVCGNVRSATYTWTCERYFCIVSSSQYSRRRGSTPSPCRNPPTRAAALPCRAEITFAECKRACLCKLFSKTVLKFRHAERTISSRQ